MNNTMQALKEPIQQALRDFAYLDLEVVPGDCEHRVDWALSSIVKCEGRCSGTVTVFMSLELAIRTADAMLGTESNFRQQLDVIGELANILAGNAYEVLYDGLRPARITTPRILPPHLATTMWNEAVLEHRYLLQSENSVDGGLVVAFPWEPHKSWK